MVAISAVRVSTVPLMRWLALLLLFNVVAAGVLPGVANARQISTLDSAGSVVVCTAAGMVVLDLDGQSQGTAAGDTRVCALCLPLMHVGAALSAPTAMAVLPQPLPLSPTMAWPDSHGGTSS
ncbi:DUF2946 family protein [Magnetospirillum aberrantis]|uniref:DUF2946 domain-containing protein n=1 Tax=Magnetospirillum aberrantis SpK TaxID=908842 RepID=A0A7C9QVP2_9PROT|nr:DUF2946 family protein [Magnetospirillum aberrantis]NFV81301.1 hypothetical protein [Magnetospirillum aberrantis SpK]